MQYSVFFFKLVICSRSPTSTLSSKINPKFEDISRELKETCVHILIRCIVSVTQIAHRAQQASCSLLVFFIILKRSVSIVIKMFSRHQRDTLMKRRLKDSLQHCVQFYSRFWYKLFWSFWNETNAMDWSKSDKIILDGCWLYK